MRHPHPYLRILVVTAATTACLATTGAVAFASNQPSRVQPSHIQLTKTENDAEKQNITVVQTALQVVFNEHRVDQIDQFSPKTSSSTVHWSHQTTPAATGSSGGSPASSRQYPT
jgi:hypothetical protein